MAPQPSSFVLTLTEDRPYYLSTDLFKLIDRKESLRLASISGNNVGAVGIGVSGKVYLGINVELQDLPLDHSIHAVQFLVANLALNSEKQLLHLAVSAKDPVFDAPCARCCQFLQELKDPFIKILRKDPNTKLNEYVTLKSLRSYPGALLEIFRGGRYLLDDEDNKLTPLYPYGGVHTDLQYIALEAAKKSFAPYSKCPSGVALKDRDGNVYKGWYMESCPYNHASLETVQAASPCNHASLETVQAESPYNHASLGPVQAALVEFVIKGNTKFDTIVKAVLVEKQIPESDCNPREALMKSFPDVSQEKTARMILEKIAPRCDFKVFHLEY